MSDPVLLGILGIVLALVNGVIVVVVGQWADARRKRADALAEAERERMKTASATHAASQAASVQERVAEQSELARVRAEYREEIKELREEIRALRERLDHKEAENRDLSVTVAKQDARIRDLEDDLARLHQSGNLPG